MKRLLDTLIVSLLLCILFPLLIIVVYKIKQSLGSPIMFRQPLPDQQRLTPFGNTLRSMSVDELPTQNCQFG